MAPLLVLFSADCVGKLSATSLPTPTFWPWFPPAPRWRSEHPQQLWPPDLFPLVFQTPGRGHGRRRGRRRGRRLDCAAGAVLSAVCVGVEEEHWQGRHSDERVEPSAVTQRADWSANVEASPTNRFLFFSF